MRTYTIGRSGDNDVVIGDRSVSRRHAELRVEDGRYRIVDLGSTNGTYVRDGQDWAKIEQAYVSADERIMLGDTVTTVAALLSGATGAADPDASIRGGAVRLGGSKPRSHDAGFRPDAAPAGARSSRLPWMLLAGAVLLLIAAGVFAAIRFWGELQPLIRGAPAADQAAPPPATWERVIGGAGDDVGQAAVPTADGGLLIAGRTDSKGAGGTDLWLVRLDAAGSTVWEKTYGTEGEDAAYAADAAGDGYIVAGAAAVGADKGSTGWMMRVDGIGTELWSDKAGSSDGYRAVRSLESGGFVLAGAIREQDRSHAWVVAVDENGQNARPFIHRKGSLSAATDVLSLGADIVAVGTLDSTGRGRPGLYVVKLDKALRPRWERVWRGLYDDAHTHVLALEDGGFLVAGTTGRTERGARAGTGRITRLDGGGNKLWDRLIGVGWSESVNAVAAGATGAVLAGSIVAKAGDSEDGWLIQVDDAGKIVWDRRFGGDGVDRIHGLKALPGGGLIAVGSTSSKGAGGADLWVLRLDAEGRLATPPEAPPDKPDGGPGPSRQ